MYLTVRTRTSVLIFWQCDPHETNFILTEAPNAPSPLQRNSDEMVFEEFEFAGYYRTIGSSYYINFLVIALSC